MQPRNSPMILAWETFHRRSSPLVLLLRDSPIHLGTHPWVSLPMAQVPLPPQQPTHVDLGKSLLLKREVITKGQTKMLCREANCILRLMEPQMGLMAEDRRVLVGVLYSEELAVTLGEEESSLPVFLEETARWSLGSCRLLPVAPLAPVLKVLPAGIRILEWHQKWEEQAASGAEEDKGL